jgi:ligand-binding sensor domain-containing protein
LTSDIIQAIYKDKYGKLWFGTDGGGVFTWNGKEFKKFE